MLLFSPQNKLIFRDNKVQIIPEGKAASDCWCCGPQDNCYTCQDPTSPNNGKKFYGGTTTTSGFPSTFDHYNGVSSFNEVCGTFYSKYAMSYRTTGLSALNYTWTNTPNAINDCTNIPSLERVTKHNVLQYVTPMGVLGVNPCGLPRRLLFVWESTVTWGLTYGVMAMINHSWRMVYFDPACNIDPSVPPIAPPSVVLYHYYQGSGDTCRSTSRVNVVPGLGLSLCGFLNITVSTTPNFLP